MEQSNLGVSRDAAVKASQLLKELSHPDRLLILCHLSGGEMSAGDLAKESKLSLSAFSQHLAILRHAEILKANRVGKCLYYSIQNDSVIQLLNTLKSIFCPS